MITAEHISKIFNDIKAVDNISFEVKEGETMVLLGTSGCGKTTTLKMLNRLIDASSGFISIDGKNIFDQQPEILRRTIGYVSQSNGLFPHYSVEENVSVVPRLLKWEKSKTQRRAQELLEQLKLPLSEFGHKYPDELSGGQQQRVAIARALISNPPVLLMDEPFGALDPITRAGVRKEFLELPELKQKTIVLVTHDVQEAFELGDHICLMDKGKIVQAGTAKDLILKPANTFVRTFFDHQRLFLELSALAFQDIWEIVNPDLDVENDINKASHTEINAETSLWAGMEMLSDAGNDALPVRNDATGTLKFFTTSSIQKAYRTLKRHN
ncbi:ATP-binding cassette domain-containing protein [Dyadobacter sp. CY399]|uniref:ATP-binding cassette domain-containing protein n=1 Tax=Dyadobacter fanqingshengii TaxID=2906443 RepID=A0A9X1T9Q4_9BACT|nr:ATP-binding cassette domain-containing protein [Dyadobacter fanqingshengii]MCF0040896.1 ATP-binding cassette domain-containing protein [Dyadobacter fanqingshengii]USJ37372.1 ATP-binding cassette domain-containing protein [Dyadobacter fanqingshengii]